MELRRIRAADLLDSAVKVAASAGAEERLRRLPAQPLPELPGKPCLADPGVAENRHEVRVAIGHGAAIALLQLRQLAVSAHEDGLQPADAARPHQRQRADEPPADDPLRLSPRLDSRRLRELERPAGGSNGSLADEDLPG